MLPSLSIAKLPLNFNDGLAKLELTSLVKQATVRSIQEVSFASAHHTHDQHMASLNGCIEGIAHKAIEQIIPLPLIRDTTTLI